MVAAHFGRRIGTALKEGIERKQSVLQGLWHDPFMAAASRAIADRMPLVDLIVHVTDARIPLSSQCDLLRNYQPSSKHILALNKADLACRSGLEVWTQYFTKMNCISCRVNAHNKDSIRQVGKLKRTDHGNYTATVMLIGIPNVGKSALANALHQVGRISAAEKGKLKHATVSPEPGETKDIRSFKIGSHPNIYVLDTPAVLSPEVPDADLLSKLMLTGQALSEVKEFELQKHKRESLNVKGRNNDQQEARKIINRGSNQWDAWLVCGHARPVCGCLPVGSSSDSHVKHDSCAERHDPCVCLRF